MSTFDYLFTILIHPTALFFWIPLMALVIPATIHWRKCRFVWRRRYNAWQKLSLLIPLLVVMEIIGIAVWFSAQPNYKGRDWCEHAIAYLFYSLIPVIAYQVWHFRGCRKFVLFASLAQLWIAATTALAAALTVNPI